MPTRCPSRRDESSRRSDPSEMRMRELFSTIRYNLPGIWYKKQNRMKKLCVGLLILASSTLVRAQGSQPEFRWAGDPEGGAPYVEASPSDPNTLVGFDVEIADLIARGLGRTPRFVLVN